MDPKETKINQLAASHPEIPRDLIARAVSSDGVVDEAILGAAMQGFSAGTTGRRANNEAEIETLTASLKTARENRNATAVISLRRRLNELGVPNPA